MSLKIEQTLRKAKNHAKKGDIDQARKFYNDILERYPKNRQAILGLNTLGTAKIAAETEASREQVNTLIALFNQGDFQQVVSYAEALERQFPNMPTIPSILGATNVHLSNFERAATNYTKSLHIEPNDAKMHNNLGIVLNNMGRIEEALLSFKTAIQLNPKFFEAYNNLGNGQKDLGKLDDAVTSYKNALQINSRFAEAHGNLGSVLIDLGGINEAIVSYQKALQTNPDNASMHYGLGIALQLNGHAGEAIDCYKKAIQINPAYAEAYNNLGLTLQEQGRVDEAIDSYRKALSIKPDFALVHNNLGNALRELGQRDSAIAYYRSAIAINPGFAEAHKHLALTKKFTEEDDDIVAMESVYSSSNCSEEQKMHLAFGLGKAFEDLAQYEKAFSYYSAGNTLKRETYDYSIGTIDAVMTNWKELFTADLFHEYEEAGAPDGAPVFILGMPRSGTSLVEQILSSHKNVYGAGELNHLGSIITSHFPAIESPKFRDIIDHGSAINFSQAGEGYLHLLKENNPNIQLITDKMPLNFQYIGMIKLILPNAKIIHCCRDPRDTCLSIYKNLFSTFGNRYAYDLNELGQYYNLYADLMAHWHKVLPGFIYDISYENIFAVQEAQSRALLAFCGLDWDDACLEFYQTKRTVRTASATQVRQPIYKDSIQLWKQYEAWLTPLLDVLID